MLSVSLLVGLGLAVAARMLFVAIASGGPFERWNALTQVLVIPAGIVLSVLLTTVCFATALGKRLESWAFHLLPGPRRVEGRWRMRRCEACGYDLTDLPTATRCPECGTGREPVAFKVEPDGSNKPRP